MKNSMTTTRQSAATASANVKTTSTVSATTAVNVKVSATDKYFTLRDGITSKVICKIAKGEGFKSEYDEENNVTKLYLTGDSRCECGEFGTIYEYKIDISEPDFVINGNVDEVIFDLIYDNRNVEFVGKSCYIMKGNHFWHSDTCSVYCGK